MTQKLGVFWTPSNHGWIGGRESCGIRRRDYFMFMHIIKNE